MKITAKFASLLLRLDRALTQLLFNKRTMFYHELAKLLGGYSPRSKWVACALGMIVEADQEDGVPLRSSLIVRTDTLMPGDGYFWKLEEIGIIKDRTDASECLKVWKDQMAKLGIAMPTPA